MGAAENRPISIRRGTVTSKYDPLLKALNTIVARMAAELCEDKAVKPAAKSNEESIEIDIEAETKDEE